MRVFVQKGIALWAGTAVFWLGVSSGLPAFSEPLWTEKSAKEKSKKAVAQELFHFSKLVRELSTSIVNIRTLEQVQTRYYRDYSFEKQGQARNFPSPFTHYEPRGEGSGFVIHKDGYILTNAHVVAFSDEIQVEIIDGTLFEGQVIGVDEMIDVALVKIDAPISFEPLPLGNSGKLNPGEWVVAIGNPFGLQHTATLGIISAKGRLLGRSPYDDFLQFDASINPGNSGSPLINVHGEVVGINTAQYNQGQGLAFALPIDLIKMVLPQLKEKGRVTRSWLGVSVRDISLALKKATGIQINNGSYISEIAQNSPAAKSGLQVGDVVTQFNELPIKNARQLPIQSAYTPPGTTVNLTVIRKGKRRNLPVQLEALPQAFP